jgi:hypothetical protein
VRKHRYRLPEDLMTVGLYGPVGGGFTARYVDPHFECINYLDESGQHHVGEHNAVNLGAHVPHLGPGSGMELVADRFAPKAETLFPAATSAPSPPLAGESWRAAARRSQERVVRQAKLPPPHPPPQAQGNRI